MAAEILGIQFTKAEQEWNINVVQAQIQAADKSNAAKKQQLSEPAKNNGNGVENNFYNF